MAILDEKITARLLDQIEGNSAQEKWTNCRQEYPWYPLPWLMTANTKTGKQKAALWFRNEHRIHWLLSNDNHFNTPGLAVELLIIEQEEPLVVSDNETIDTAGEIADIASNESNDYSEEVIAEQALAEIQDAGIDQEPERVNLDDIEASEDKIEEAIQHPSPEITDVETVQENIELPSPENPVIEPGIKVADETEISSDEILQEPEAVLLTAEEVDLKREMESTEDLINVDDDFSSLEEDAEKSAVLPIADQENDTPDNTKSIGSFQSKPLEVAEEKVTPGIISNKEEELVFEPLYTTDYFASQGIKVDPRAVPETKFDRQVKTFTQWLKTMKRIAPEAPIVSDPVVDAQASESVAEKEVITEAMAEVLEKQGKYQKAIEILGKLILLHPEKSTFFAAQIENLKAKQ